MKYVLLWVLATSFAIESFSKDSTAIHSNILSQIKEKTFTFSCSKGQMRFKFSYDQSSKKIKILNLMGEIGGDDIQGASISSHEKGLTGVRVFENLQLLEFKGQVKVNGDKTYPTSIIMELDVNKPIPEFFFVGWEVQAENYSYYKSVIFSNSRNSNGATCKVSGGNQTTTTNKPAPEISDQSSLLEYLRNKTFKAESGNEIKIGYSGEGNTYGVMVNDQLMFFNLSYTFLSKHMAIVKGESINDNGLVKIYVDSRSNTLKNGETIYYLKE